MTDSGFLPYSPRGFLSRIVVSCVFLYNSSEFDGWGNNNMLGKAMETLFIRVWVMMKLNLFFWLFSAAGGVVFGIGPALKVISELFVAHGFEYKEITLKEGWQLFKHHFQRGNVLFWGFTMIAAFLAYNLYLSLQVQGLLFLMIDFILVFALLYLFATFMYVLIFDANYDISLGHLVRLGFTSNFSSFITFLKMIIGSGVILGFTWKYKGLILFGTVALLFIWNYLTTKYWRTEIEGRLE